MAGLGSVQFQNWNCSSIPIPILELELELKLVELKMELELKTLELELKTGIDFLQLLPQHLLVNQQFPNFSYNTGHNLPRDWLLMQQGLSSRNIAPCSMVTKDTWGGYPVPLEQTAVRRMVTINMINISLPPWHKTKLSLLNKVKWFQGLRWNYP